jgi:uncharacterized protein
VLNYEVEARLLAPFVPRGTELDLWEDRALVSLVGFQFLDARLRGWAMPFHQQFDEINLRFYVRHWTGDGWRRGVVFLREVAAMPLVACVANWVYHEHYAVRAMRQDIALPSSPVNHGHVAYSLRDAARWLTLSADITGEPTPLVPDSEAEFILEHYWGYTPQPDGSTQEYAVEHRPWRTWETTAATFTGDGTRMFGPDFAAVFRQPPRSAFVADGSDVVVREGRSLESVGVQCGTAVPVVEGLPA